MNVEIVRAGPLTTVQDLGRFGSADIGVSRGGALDQHACRVANILVGNDERAAVLELTLGGTQLRFENDRAVAWCGASFNVSVPAGRRVLVRAGETITFASPEFGCRAWLAIAGGIDVPEVLGSRSTDLRAQFGGWNGRALREGDRLPLGATRLCHADRVASWSAPTEWASTASPWPVLRFVRGGDWSRFETPEHFGTAEFEVTVDVNRMGARLSGPMLQRSDNAELASETVLPGTVQVPPNGQPIILLGDCQTIGGYPKIAHVITVDLPHAAQLRPGDRVRFREVTLAEAHHLLVRRERDLQRFRVGVALR